MPRSTKSLNVYLEVGAKKTFAGALDWPGWCRSGRDQESALQALCDYGPRYARVLRGSRLDFSAPADVSAFAVVERLAGDATTDFGAPGIAPAADKRPVDDAELARLQTILRASWRALDTAVGAAAGKELRKGPRGGGREVSQMVRHVLDAEGAYLSRLGFKLENKGEAGKELNAARKEILAALASAAHGEVEPRGPRGGARWSPRYFVRRDTWHILDHAWEIGDRMQTDPTS